MSLENKCLFCHYEIIDKSQSKYLCKNCYEKLAIHREVKNGYMYDLHSYVLEENRFITDKLNQYINNNKSYYIRIFSELLIKEIKNNNLLENTDYIYCLPIDYNSYYNPSYILLKNISSKLKLNYVDDINNCNLFDKEILIITLYYLKKEHESIIRYINSKKIKRIKLIELVHKN